MRTQSAASDTCWLMRALTSLRSIQAAVDAAIDDLKNLKLDLEKKQKVGSEWGSGNGSYRCRMGLGSDGDHWLPCHTYFLALRLQALEDATGKTAAGNKEAFRAAMLNTLERRLFFIPSFKIYGSVSAALRSNGICPWTAIAWRSRHTFTRPRPHAGGRLLRLRPARLRDQAEHHAALAQPLCAGGGHAGG